MEKSRNYYNVLLQPQQEVGTDHPALALRSVEFHKQWLCCCCMHFRCSSSCTVCHFWCAIGVPAGPRLVVSCSGNIKNN
uniref:Uncharacterized protein n=1 Tax=Globodera rostochiensis TaxID=31243 RepID=A0A914HPV9_GLORO